MQMGDARDFNAGYILACANIVNQHDEPGMAADVARELGVSWDEVKRMRLSPYDMAALRKIKRYGRRDAFRAALAAMEES